MSWMKHHLMNAIEAGEPIHIATPKQARRTANSDRISEIMKLVRAGKTMSEALEIVDKGATP